MTPLPDVLVRVSVLLAVGLAACAVLRRRSASLRHAVLAATVLGVPLVPLASALLPPIVLPAVLTPALVADAPAPPAGSDADAAHVASTRSALEGQATGDSVDWTTWLIAVWSAGALVALGRVVWSLATLIGSSRRAQPVTCLRWKARLAAVRRDAGVTRDVVLLTVPGARLLAVWGWRRPRMLLPACALDWPEARIDAVLHHELAHVRRADWLVHLHAALVGAALWWHPLVWLARRRLAAESERACDDAVLAQGMEPSAYAEHLVAIARALQPTRAAALAVPMASPSTLHRRIVAMLNPALNRTAPTRHALALLAAAAVVLVLPLSLLRAEQAAQTLQGVVYDPTGAVLPGVTLVLQTGEAKAESTTDAAGQFAFAGVAPGRHVLGAQVRGFRAFRQDLDLKQESDWDRTVTLQVGRIQESIRVTSKRGPATAATATGPTPVRVGGNIRPPRKLKDVKPVYPAAMRDAGREAKVTIDAVIGADGRVIAAHVTSPEVHPDFAVAAVDAVKGWVFSPTLLNGAPIDVVMTVSIEFTLE